MQPIAHQFEIQYHDQSIETVEAANVSEAGDWMHFTDHASQMLFMAHKAVVKSIRRIGPVAPAEPVRDVAE